VSESPEGRAAVAREGAGERWARRAITIPACLLGLAIAVPLLPVLLAGALLLDLFRDRRLPTVRLVLFSLVYLGCESAGLLASLVLWLGSIGDRERRLRWFYALQSAWASSIFAAGCRIFGIEVDVVGDESIGRGPLLLFSRHTSLADTILPAVYVARRHGLRLRWVLKRELLWDPCLDVVGRVLPNVFVRRGSYDSAREIAAVRSLARDLGEDEGVLVYPEGTRFTPAVRDRVAAALAVADPARAQRLAGLRHVLPPRTGGPLALLDVCPPAEVVFLAHVGLDGAARLGDVWRGSLIGRRVRLWFRRVQSREIPVAAADRLAWLDAQWSALDDWIDACLAERDGASPAPASAGGAA